MENNILIGPRTKNTLITNWICVGNLFMYLFNSMPNCIGQVKHFNNKYLRHISTRRLRNKTFILTYSWTCISKKSYFL